MKIKVKRYYVERKSNHSHPLWQDWYKVPFIEHRSRSYCDGYVDAMDSLYPSDPCRIIKEDEDGIKTVVRETKGRGAVHLN
jgi:hypothetical protein